jgi:hypothetical protein
LVGAAEDKDLWRIFGSLIGTAEDKDLWRIFAPKKKSFNGELYIL